MHLPNTGGATLRQTIPPRSGPAEPPPRSASSSPEQLRSKVLLTFKEAGEMLGIGERMAHYVVPTLVTPVVLGPRCTRIVRAELEVAVANLPRRTDPAEPTRLRTGKAKKRAEVMA